MIQLIIMQSKNELAEEEKVCHFIENIAHNKYNEDGSIRLNTFHYSDIVYVVESFKETASGNQMIALQAIIILSIILSLYAIYLSRKVNQAKNNREIEWKNSGIGNTRSGTMDDEYAAFY